MRFLDKLIVNIMLKRLEILHDLWDKYGDREDVNLYVRKQLKELDIALKDLENRNADNS